MNNDSKITTIGRTEMIDLLDLNLVNVPAKVDTGADSSAIWASYVKDTPEGLECIFFGPNSPFYTGLVVRMSTGYKITRVANSFGQKELRYKLKLRIRVNGRAIRATFTLSDRSQKTYPILLGRRLLKGKFIVDVSKGEALEEIEKSKAKKLRSDLKNITERKEIT